MQTFSTNANADTHPNHSDFSSISASRFYTRWLAADNAPADSPISRANLLIALKAELLRLFSKQQLNDLNPAAKPQKIVAELCLSYPSCYTVFETFLQKVTNLSASTNGNTTIQSSQKVPLEQALRRLRNLVVCTLIDMDLNQQADLHCVVSTMTEFADFAIQTALRAATADMQQQFGVPVAETTHEAQELIVLGMGKLGGAELNISSDIDLIFVYAEDGETQITEGQRRLSNHEFFSRVGKKLIATLAEIGEDGFTFRVDMALRPNGASGPLVCSFNMLEQYLLVQGREWERYAWVKARAITGIDDQIKALNDIVLPFIYRRYLDFSVIDALRDMHGQIRAEVIRQETRHPDRANNVKLGRGGIREIEFLSQVFQLIRGGREPLLRDRSTRQTLINLAQLGILEAPIVTQLLASYTFLRNLEHRLQYLDDAQTHNMPANPDDFARIAHMMSRPNNLINSAQLQEQLTQHRQFVAQQFDTIFGKKNAPTANTHSTLISANDVQNSDVLLNVLQKLNFEEPQAAAELLKEGLQSSKFKTLSEANKNKGLLLINRALHIITTLPDQQLATLQRLFTLLEAIVRRTAYLALLIEYPNTLERLLRIMHASHWAAHYLTRHPILLDELLAPAYLLAPPNWDEFTQELQTELQAHHNDQERQLDTLREYHHAQLFRLLAQDLEGKWSVEALADQLSQLADIIVAATIAAIWQTLPQRHCDTPQFAVIAYGKLGGKELGYASDLDVVFVYQDDHDLAPANYAKLAQRFITWMTTHTPAGILFDIDIALRPDGASGLMVSSLAAFTQYQLKSAWAWEHQALTRARCCTGPKPIADAFDALRQNVLCQQRDAPTLKAQVVDMRTKMRSAHITAPDLFDLKNSVGGMIDIEFMVQYLVLQHAHHYPQLCANYGNIALLNTCGELGLIPADLAHQVADIYRHWRKLQHGIRLHGIDKAVIKMTLAEPMAQEVATLWDCIFG